MYQLNTLTLTDKRRQDWDDFVYASDEATFFHLSGWQDIIDSVGHKCFYLYATQANTIVGILPLARVKSRLFGDALVSTPFCVYGGAIGSDDVKRFLELSAQQLATKLQVQHLELRNQHAQNNNLETRVQHANFSTPLADSPEQILAAVKKKQRAVIRHSLNESLHYTLDSSLDDFYQTYSQSVRNLGTPVFSKTFFAKILTTFANESEILTVRKDNKAISSVLSFYFKGQVLPYYGGGIEQARQLKSNDFMYYQLMCHAKLNKQCDQFDFGRSKIDSGAYSYKKHWGMTATELPYQYYLVTADELPNLSPNNPKYQLFIRLWKKLPLKFSQWLGPKLSKYLG
ncbi:FemAB family XrtA/PEP-CTERM system-associated protein [Rheinheimera sp. MMS21-TC3]|uniref:FemAB family XrtA/PEP-CTERM system-associated protein n=1 Tax=Rheinheimera sp. MMS21-TC3 TaxID=3072790 RepID=UPI0028C3CAE3|nr:FemAB family XrtA/PEP-CTERM system-associated protein [Rheinheimera sp. MMS21-TC3]WNO60696.1 FemAB family PEP-CTERM system-associated protein [Rheinheimera sp. MMS21-TC3]